MGKQKKLRRQLLVYFATVAFLPVLTMMVYYGYTVQQSTRDRLNEDRCQRVSYALDKIENKVTQIDEFATWIFQNEQLQQLLSRTHEQLDGYDETTHSAVQDLLKQFSYRPIAGDVLALFLLGDNGLDLRGGTDASLINVDAVYPLLEAQEGCDRYWGCTTENLTKLTKTPQVLFYRHPMTVGAAEEPCGWLVLLFSDQLFREECADLLVSTQDSVRLRNRNGGTLDAYGSTQQGPIYSSTSLSLGWTLESQTDDGVLAVQLHTAACSAWVTAALILVLILLMAWYLSRNFTRPIERIFRQVARISAGDFSHPRLPASEQMDEIGQLALQIAEMGDNIQRLMNEQLLREQEKRHLEVQILQNQLNPHFLYNTLNAIRLMAALQGKKGIQNMLEALGRLLRANLALQDEFIPLEEELALLDSYVLLQNAAYKGKITFHCERLPAQARRCLIPKLLLQPLVENAIVHGIVPRPQGGTITLTARVEDERLHIRIADTGIGISPERAAQLQKRLRNPQSGQGAAGIGLWNTAYRLSLLYGSGAALSIQRQADEGTEVMIYLPAKEAL